MRRKRSGIIFVLLITCPIFEYVVSQSASLQNDIDKSPVLITLLCPSLIEKNDAKDTPMNIINNNPTEVNNVITSFFIILSIYILLTYFLLELYNI